MENEIWKSVIGYEGFYEVSNFGNVRSLDNYIPLNKNKNIVRKKHGFLLKQQDNGMGYLRVKLTRQNKCKSVMVHRLIAESFIEKTNESHRVTNHKDGNKKNNNVENLEWTTQSENCKHAYKTGLKFYTENQRAATAINFEKGFGWNKKGHKNYRVPNEN